MDDVPRTPTNSGTAALPPYIHFVWVGSSPSEVHTSRLDSWAALNPTANVLLWTEEAIRDLLGRPRWRHLQPVYAASKNRAVESDVARFLILQEFGGMYMDIDMEACRPVAELRWTRSGFVARESRWLIVGGALGLHAGSTFGELALECMRKCADAGVLDNFMSGPPLVTELHRAFRAAGVPAPTVLEAAAFFPDNPFRFPRKLIGASVPYAIHLYDHSWSEGGELSLVRRLMRVAQVVTPRDVAVGARRSTQLQLREMADELMRNKVG